VLVAVVFLARGFDACVDLVRPMAVWRLRPGWWLFGMLWVPFIATLCLAIMTFVFGKPFDPEAIHTEVALNPGVFRSILIGSFVGGIVWIGYSVGLLSKRYGTFLAAQLVGLIWTLWWLPMVYFNVGVVPELPIAALLINQTGIATLCAAIYLATKSGLLVLFTQVVFNTSILIFPVTPVAGGVDTYWTFAILYYLSAAAIFYVLQSGGSAGVRSGGSLRQSAA
jgi:hypothetical protein